MVLLIAFTQLIQCLFSYQIWEPFFFISLSRPKTVHYAPVGAEAWCSSGAIQTLVHLPLPPRLALCSTLLSRLHRSFHSVLFLPPSPSPHAWNPLPLPQLKTTLCNRGSGQPSLSQLSQLVSAKPRVSLEASCWHPFHSALLVSF